MEEKLPAKRLLHQPGGPVHISQRNSQRFAEIRLILKKKTVSSTWCTEKQSIYFYFLTENEYSWNIELE